MAPRLTIGAVVTETELSRALARAGHTVRGLDARNPGSVADVDAVLLDMSDTVRIAELADAFAAYVRPRQLFIHTALAQGAQLLDAVETRGAIVMAAHNVFSNHWVTSAADELGETVIGLLIAEIGGVSHTIADSQRMRAAAALRIQAHESVLRADSFDLLSSAVESLEAFGHEYSVAPRGSVDKLSPAELERMRQAIDDPGVAALFVELQRRSAQQLGDAETELWSMFTTNQEGK
ncbi:hypothetical protein [Corynebacterium lipophiloflavum]|uniref:CGL2689-like C-terminal domain-containing protein n=1 Tax=Corynebacterium lipophiloflavum (strain ATCC 700352 / DSM 44291 / CCUG 37336 / JCM 10383 / DMMZ 1944) TaxID=525263 RepID=C0XP57_CORLD|nr:hypothetical protein [Corynebacterium lipophiloflavum]EEI17982.1 hypothetical protein HMPREF0298_0227 [Corynebacterium lipophiloflavum DSM 44291]